MITLCFHALWSYIFVLSLDLQLYGTAISNILTASINLVLLFLYTHLRLPELKEAWFLPGKESY